MKNIAQRLVLTFAIGFCYGAGMQLGRNAVGQCYAKKKKDITTNNSTKS